jgi:hypothetical protein
MDIKLQLTKEFLKDTGLPDDQKSLEKYLWAWWSNPRLNGDRSMGLTEQGYDVISKQVGLKFYQVDLPKDTYLSSQLIIWLDKFIDCPYYLTKKSIFVSREKVAVQLVLFSGDLQKFGNAKQRAQQSAKTS